MELILIVRHAFPGPECVVLHGYTKGEAEVVSSMTLQAIV